MGWFKSLMAGAVAIASEIAGPEIGMRISRTFTRDVNYLYFTVRDPFPSRTSQASLVMGKITRDEPLTIVSQMAESGVIFSDGIESDFLAFNSGAHAVIAPADKKGRLVI